MTATSEFDDDDKTLICVGKFDHDGLPIVTSRHLSEYATATFQIITLKALLERCVQPEPLQVIHIRHQEGFSIRVEHNPDGFIAYLVS